MKAKIFLFVLSILSIFCIACNDNLKDSEIVEIVKTELQECGAPEGKTDLWFKPYGIGDLERANIVVSAGGYIQLDENKVPYVVWPDNQTMYDWLLTVASGNLIWSVNDYETNGEEFWLVEAEGGPNLVHDPSGIIAGSQNVVLPLPKKIIDTLDKPVRRANLYPPVKVFKNTLKTDFVCIPVLEYPD